MKIFVYGMLKFGQPKSWMIPFSSSMPKRLYGYKMYMRKDGKAGIKKGSPNDFVDGEMRTVSWTNWFTKMMLLSFLDWNEGTYWGVYERIQIDDFYTYIYKRSTDGCKSIHKWEGINEGK